MSMRHFMSAIVFACAGISFAATAPARADNYNWPNSAFVGLDELPKTSARKSGKSTSRESGQDRTSRQATTPRRASTERADVGTLGGGSVGVASFYWQPQRVASGGWFNPNAMTAAHKTLPFGTRVRVTHLGNGRSVDVTINDRGPYIAGRIIDLSKAAAGIIGMQGQGIAKIRMDVIGRR
jgi:rare lipoprotein A